MRSQFGTVRRTQRLPATIGLEIHLGPAVHGEPLGRVDQWSRNLLRLRFNHGSHSHRV